MPPLKPRHASTLPTDAPPPPPEAESIPDDQSRALDRRHALDAQQREFAKRGIPAPHLWTRRPPG